MVVRHGRTEANASGRLLGRRLNPPLDDLGERQADAVARAIGPVDRVVTSPLRRARQTAEAITSSAEIDERWVELDYGELDGTPLDSVPDDVLRGGASTMATPHRAASRCPP